jgi:type VI secretion system protein ImpA
MVSPAVLDVDQLVQPLGGERPTGEDLRRDPSPTSVYYKVKDCRTTARATERQNQMNGDEQVPVDWKPILMLVPDVLAERSKDLEVAAYFLEALVRETGLAGLRDGFRLVRELVAKYGESLYPEPDEDGVETLVAPLTGLNGEDGEGTLILPIRQVAITDQSSVGQFGTSDYQQALEIERLSGQQRERRVEHGGVTLSDFRLAVSETSAAFFRELLDDTESCLAEHAELVTVLDATYGQFSPPTSNVRRVLEEVRDTIKTVAGDKLALVADAADEATDEATTDAPTGAAAAGAPAPKRELETREDAFKTILKVAEFFRRTEPHSPLSYALERIVRWGRLPLPELMKELIADGSSVTQMFNLVGIDTREDEES